MDNDTQDDQFKVLDDIIYYAYESQQLIQVGHLYSIYDKEMLAIMHSLTKFEQYLVGSKFVIHTNHNSLRYFLKQQDLNKRQQK